jgi:hypothetical protein
MEQAAEKTPEIEFKPLDLSDKETEGEEEEEEVVEKPVQKTTTTDPKAMKEYLQMLKKAPVVKDVPLPSTEAEPMLSFDALMKEFQKESVELELSEGTDDWNGPKSEENMLAFVKSAKSKTLEEGEKESFAFQDDGTDPSDTVAVMRNYTRFVIAKTHRGTYRI